MRALWMVVALASVLPLTGFSRSASAQEAVRGGAADPVVQFINGEISQGWEDNGVRPSEVADDAEWLRRVYLDVVGHIPPAETVEKFLADRDKNKRSRVIEELLADPAYVRNFTTVWTNLMIGQQTPDRVSRPGMQKFLREAFARNRPWNDVVFDVVSAEGHFEENGAVNFLLAQMTMRDEGVQATAKTTRLFLGIQVQCTQCHNHPFNDWKQDQFWQYNSFFRQARRVDHDKYDPESGRMVDDYSELVFDDFNGPVFYEKRSGLMQVAYPIFQGSEVDPGPGVDRRQELAKLMVNDEEAMIAKAMVNRMWGHMFGYGFTRPVDDMGPHNPPSHPELLDRLAKEFAASGYDVKQLIRWIANSDAYGLTSKFGRNNDFDNPAAGETPLFSHMYVKMMTAEQLFDSLVVATAAHKSGRSGWENSEKQRQDWLQQFVQTFGTDEGDEATTFNGSIPQALMMMNGPLIQDAVSAKPGSHLNDMLNSPGSDAEKIRELYLSTLSRLPSRSEASKALQFMRTVRTPQDRLAAYQDLFWALLNANEFVLVY